VPALNPIKVLVIDDSAVMRAIMNRVISAQPDMQVVGLASDPILATERMRLTNPDVITLDVEMPRMSGMEFLATLMRTRPMPVVMVSSLTARGAETTLKALELGAVDFVAKPAAAAGADLERYADEVTEKIRAASTARPLRPAADSRGTPPRVALSRPRRSLADNPRNAVIAIGASTGGVEALRELLSRLPAAMPPILIAQHMPGGFTRSFADRLNGLCEIDVREAVDGEPVVPGRAYIAPGGRHMQLAGKPGTLGIKLTDGAPVNRHRPSVDCLFRSAAQAAGSRCIGVMLSGMGADGADAMLALRNAGAFNIAQDEASCVVFGMPRQAIAAGAVHEVLALDAIARRLAELSGCAGTNDRCLPADHIG